MAEQHADMAELEAIFMQAVGMANAADEDGFRQGTEVGEFFHRLRPPTGSSKKERKTVYRNVLRRLELRGALETRQLQCGNKLLRPTAPV